MTLVCDYRVSEILTSAASEILIFVVNENLPFVANEIVTSWVTWPLLDSLW
jgi:hypothetical protein